ncbi:MAG: hypothetical protein ChlgKO_07540 [Chlamydiales bacterium]
MLAGTFYKVFGKSIREFVVKRGDRAGCYFSMDRSLRLSLQSLENSGEGGKKIAEKMLDCYRCQTGILNLSRLSLTCIPGEVYSLEGLTDLDLSYNSFEYPPFPQGGKAVKFLKKLTVLNLSSNSIENIPKSFRKYAESWFSLESLDISSNKDLSEESLDAICSIPFLKKLNLAFVRSVDVSTIKYLSKLSPYCEVELKGTPLEKNLINIKLDKEFLSMNRGLFPRCVERYLCSLKIIDLSNCGIIDSYTDEEHGMLEQLSRCSSVESLNVSSNGSSDVKSRERFWNDMRQFQGLQSVDLRDNDLRYVDNCFLGNQKELRELNLSGNRNLHELPKAISDLNRLQILNITGTRINDFAQLCKLPSSCTIFIDDTMKPDLEAFLSENKSKKQNLRFVFLDTHEESRERS